MGLQRCNLKSRGSATRSRSQPARGFTKILRYCLICMAAMLGSADSDGIGLQRGSQLSAGGSKIGATFAARRPKEPQGRFPYIASLKSTIGRVHVCGGTLVHPLYVLTAAHCIEKTGMNPFVHIGGQGLNDDEETAGVAVTRVEAMIPHPKWTGDTAGGHDIALARLIGSIPDALPPALPCSSVVGPMSLEPLPSLITLGWGQHASHGEGFGGPLADFTLQMADKLRIVEDRHCVTGTQKQDDVAMCVSGEGRGVCKADSGAPLLLFPERPSAVEEGQDVLMGVASMAHDCFPDGRNDSVVLYTRVAEVLPWIEEVITAAPGMEKGDTLEDGNNDLRRANENYHKFGAFGRNVTQRHRPVIVLTGQDSKPPTFGDVVAEFKRWLAGNMDFEVVKLVVAGAVTLAIVLVAFTWWGSHLRQRFGSGRAARPRTALHAAVMEPDEDEGEDSIDSLIKGGSADVNERDQAGRTPLHYAKTKIVAHRLLNAGAHVNVVDNQSLTPLHRACSRSHGGAELVAALLKRGADANAKSNWDYTPLHMACFHGNVEVVNILLEGGADVLLKNHVGYHALHEAAFNGSLPVATLLLQHGAEASMRELAQGTMHLPGGTPIDVARARGNTEMAEKLAELR